MPPYAPPRVNAEQEPELTSLVRETVELRLYRWSLRFWGSWCAAGLIMMVWYVVSTGDLYCTGPNSRTAWVGSFMAFSGTIMMVWRKQKYYETIWNKVRLW